jgi:hypothetical protein
VPHVYEVNAPLDEEASLHREFERAAEAREAFRRGFAVSRGAVAVSEEVAAWVSGLAPGGFPVRVESKARTGRSWHPPTPARAGARAAPALNGGEFRVGSWARSGHGTTSGH